MAAAWGAGKIGSMYRVKAVDPVVHKALHSILATSTNAAAAAILGNDVRMAALSGATGAFLAETLADVMKPDEKAEVKSAIEKKMNPKEFEDAFMAKAQASTQWANFVATVAAFGLGQDAGIAYGAAHNATANNNMMCLAALGSAVAENFAVYETLYALAAAGGLKSLLDSLQIKSNADGSYEFNGQRGTLGEILDAIQALPLLLEQVMTIEFIKDLINSSGEGGSSNSKNTAKQHLASKTGERFSAAASGGGMPDPDDEDPKEKYTKLKDGDKLTEHDALTEAEKFLGKNYKNPSKDRYVSADGKRQVRFGDDDLAGHNGRWEGHVHLEDIGINPLTGKPMVTLNRHIFLKR